MLLSRVTKAPGVDITLTLPYLMVMPVLLEEVLVVQGLAARQCRLDIAEELAGPMLREAREALPLDADVDKVLNSGVHGGPVLMHYATENISGPYNG